MGVVCRFMTRSTEETPSSSLPCQSRVCLDGFERSFSILLRDSRHQSTFRGTVESVDLKGFLDMLFGLIKVGFRAVNTVELRVYHKYTS
jgi:hypothetical protein